MKKASQQETSGFDKIGMFQPNKPLKAVRFSEPLVFVKQIESFKGAPEKKKLWWQLNDYRRFHFEEWQRIQLIKLIWKKQKRIQMINGIISAHTNPLQMPKRKHLRTNSLHIPPKRLLRTQPVRLTNNGNQPTSMDTQKISPFNSSNVVVIRSSAPKGLVRRSLT